MARHNELGRKGERVARSWLIQQGYRILATNWRFKRSEVDIIARKSGILVVVEVKTRSSVHFGRPSDFVRPQKMRLLVDAATEFAIGCGHDGEIRFDIIGVERLPEGNYRLRHLEDAYFPEVDAD